MKREKQAGRWMQYLAESAWEDDIPVLRMSMNEIRFPSCQSSERPNAKEKFSPFDDREM